MFKKILLSILLIIIVLAGIIVFNALNLKSKQIKTSPATLTQLNQKQVVEHLAGAIRFQTISQFHQFYGRGKSFEELHEYLGKTFPLVHEKLQKETVNKYSLLYTWQGKNSNLKPILLMAHQDVVPVDETSAKDWKFEPFSGQITNEYVLGRGTLDDKMSLVGILEAVETLLKQNYQPERTIYLAFGHDEEIGGTGSIATVALLKSRKIQLELVLDEGGVISEGSVPGIQKSVALVGLAEKGYVSLELHVKGAGGHSSTPPPHTAIGVLSEALVKLENNQMPARSVGVSQQMLDYLAPEMPFEMKLIFGNQWLLGGLVRSQLLKSNATAASIRTSTAVTIINGGVKDNVVPTGASATVNFRIIPGETVEDVVKHVKKIIDNQSITIKFPEKQGRNPSPISDINSEAFKKVQQTIGQVFPDVLVAPYLVLGGTDSRNYTPICDNILRFVPIRLKPEDLKRLHGINERILIKNYLECVQFYRQLIQNFNEKNAN